MDQPGKVANPPRGQLNRENEHCPVPVRACVQYSGGGSLPDINSVDPRLLLPLDNPFNNKCHEEVYVLKCFCFVLFFVWCPLHVDSCKPGTILLTQCYYHRGTRLNAMKRFCICSL